mgnify:CR=1 FL=1
MVCHCAKSCLSLIQSKIHWYWNKPETTSQNRVKTIVMIDLNKEADIENATITQSSGDKRVDNKAVEAIYEAAPFREIHGLSLKEKEMIKRIEIAF